MFPIFLLLLQISVMLLKFFLSLDLCDKFDFEMSFQKVSLFLELESSIVRPWGQHPLFQPRHSHRPVKARNAHVCVCLAQSSELRADWTLSSYPVNSTRLIWITQFEITSLNL